MNLDGINNAKVYLNNAASFANKDVLKSAQNQIEGDVALQANIKMLKAANENLGQILDILA